MSKTKDMTVHEFAQGMTLARITEVFRIYAMVQGKNAGDLANEICTEVGRMESRGHFPRGTARVIHDMIAEYTQAYLFSVLAILEDQTGTVQSKRDEVQEIRRANLQNAKRLRRGKE